MKLIINEVEIDYTDSGTGAVPIILVHGFPFNQTMWKAQVAALSKPYRVITYDIRGYGNSTFGENQHSMQLYANDLILLMDKLAIEQAIVIGLSMGGYIILNAATRFPNRFMALILADTQCIADSADTKANRYKAMTQIETGGLFDYATNSIPKLLSATTIEQQPLIVAQVKDLILSTSPTTIVAGLNALANRLDTCLALNVLLMPVLILCGKEDTITPMEQAEYLHSHLLSSAMLPIDAAAHLSNIEQPVVFNQLISEFIAGVLE